MIGSIIVLYANDILLLSAAQYVIDICEGVLGQLDITAELARALAVVTVTLQVNGNSQFSGVRPQKNYWGDEDKIWHK